MSWRHLSFFFDVGGEKRLFLKLSPIKTFSSFLSSADGGYPNAVDRGFKAKLVEMCFSNIMQVIPSLKISSA
jgi:hypothetical protein